MTVKDLQNKASAANKCHNLCIKEKKEIVRAYVGIRTVSDTLVKCACIPRDFSKIIGVVPASTADRDAYTSKTPDKKANGLFIYSIFRE